MYNYDRVLPIGSVVLLQNAEKRLMIIGYQRKKTAEDTEVFDYCGCPYPEGFISAEDTAIFNHSQIDRIIAVGLQNSQQIEFAEKLRNFIAEREA